MVVFWLLACAPTEAPAEVCREGFERAPDGHCYPPVDTGEPADLEVALANLPACLPGATDGAIDLEAGCASGVCVGADEPTTTAAVGAPPTCANVGWSATDVYCTWSGNIEGLFDDLDMDGWADPGAPNERVHVWTGYAGGTVDGVGVDVRPSCYVDVLGMPSWVAFNDVGGNLRIQDLIYDAYGVQAYDWGWDDGSGLPNGVIDNLYLYGAP